MSVSAFEKKLLVSVRKFPEMRAAENAVVGVAVSGGADSLALLVALNEIYNGGKECADGEKYPAPLCVTVDHSIRPEEESAGDAAFVAETCARFGIKCALYKIPRGEVSECAARRGRGTEDAARFLRYRLFERAARENGIRIICTAHNRNDLTETLLMRFLQGSPASSSLGIARRRAADGVTYIRPFLEMERGEIESYLIEKGLSWRTDSTNLDEGYFRNRIRRRLVPLLNDCFPGWEKAVISGGEKAERESEALECLAENSGIEVGPKDGLVTIGSAVRELPFAVRERIFYRAFIALGAEERVPYSFVRTLSVWPESDFKRTAAAGFESWTKKDKLFLKKSQKEATSFGFFDIIKEGSSAFVRRSRQTGDEAGSGEIKIEI